ncbi:MAG: class F sortase [Acidimicrobiia bacterium]
MASNREKQVARRPVARWTALLLGVIALGSVIAAVSILLVSPTKEVGNVSAVEESLKRPLPTSAEMASGSTANSQPASPSSTPFDVSSGVPPNPVSRLDEIGDVVRPAPVGLVVDSITVDAPVAPFGINDRTGQMAVPHNVRDVAWYEFGPSPGEGGSAVFAAHVDLAGQGPGVFYRLSELSPGDSIAVTFDDGTTREFVVRARVTYEKNELPLETIFSREGSPVLTLITCGGGFSRSEQRYDSNVVVYAVPSGVPDQSSANHHI